VTAVLVGDQLTVRGVQWTPGEKVRVALSANRRGTSPVTVGETVVDEDGAFELIVELRRTTPRAYALVAGESAQVIARILTARFTPTPMP
jgi:hypothetical protein